MWIMMQRLVHLTSWSLNSMRVRVSMDEGGVSSGRWLFVVWLVDELTRMAASVAPTHHLRGPLYLPLRLAPPLIASVGMTGSWSSVAVTRVPPAAADSPVYSAAAALASVHVSTDRIMSLRQFSYASIRLLSSLHSPNRCMQWIVATSSLIVSADPARSNAGAHHDHRDCHNRRGRHGPPSH